jgi:hypothetical protein
MGVLDISSYFVMFFICLNLVEGVFYHRPFPPRPPNTTSLAVALLSLGFGLLQQIQHHWKRSLMQTSSTFLSRIGTLLYYAFIVLIVVEFTRSDVVANHPIDVLIFNANIQHSRWAKQAAESKTLEDAASRYRERYHAYPPPCAEPQFLSGDY